MTALAVGTKKRGRPRKVVEQVYNKYFGKDLTIKGAFDNIALLEQRIAKIEKKGK